MAKVGAQHPATERPTEALDVEAALHATRPARPEPERGAYRRVFACATDPPDSPNEERPS